MNRTNTYKTTNGSGFCCEPQAQSRNARSLPTQNVDYEKLQYYYHSDHLGSASYITNLDGEVVQHVEYVPFGEVFIEERNNTWNTPYLFNGKELDEETGLYYYGARYYNPRISLWYGIDPIAEKYPNVSPYAYCFNNPINFVDIWGLEGEDPETIGSKAEKVAIDLINQNGGSYDFSNFNLSKEQESQLYGGNGELNSLGKGVNNILSDQAYLNKYNKEAGDFFTGMVESGELSNSELSELQGIRADAVDRTKAEYMMGIFSPENVGMVLFLSFGAGGNSASTLRQKGYQFITSRFQQFAIAEAKAMTALSSKGITGFTTHGAQRAAVERGFSNQSILNIVKNGNIIKQTGKYGTPQLKYTLGANSVMVEQGGRNAGKIITTFSNQTINGVKGGFVPF